MSRFKQPLEMVNIITSTFGLVFNLPKPPTASRSKTWDKLGTHDSVGGFAKRQATSDKKRGGSIRVTTTVSAGGADELSASHLKGKHESQSLHRSPSNV